MAKPRYVYSILKPHGQSSKIPVRRLLSEAKPSYVHILNFNATWSEFQKPSQTAAERGVAEQRIFNSKTTWRGNGMLLGATVWVSKTLTMWF